MGVHAAIKYPDLCVRRMRLTVRRILRKWGVGECFLPINNFILVNRGRFFFQTLESIKSCRFLQKIDPSPFAVPARKLND